ncbi:oligosaccharide flippase family protein [Arenibaculum pallidiluteum]|uniref:oligosaccharide flippase family protein n=1 Tax=Arenibaculum pallidiluteum TaxID=2812559 RepID=UPI001A961852|nr:oligosaccharide flippase family protein [Arenibaculum pallidiluteum]
MSDLRRSVYWSTLSKYVGFVAQFASTMVLARMLTPTELGVFSVCMTFVVIAQSFREFGVSTYIIQEKDLTPGKLRSAYGFALLVSWAIATLVLLGRHLVAGFYGEPGMAEVLALLALGFFLVPFGLPARAMIVREMRFGAECAMHLATIATQVAVTLALAARGFGYMSMAWGALCGQVAGIAMLAALRPGLVFMMPSFRGWSHVVGFGSYYSAAALIYEAGIYLQNLVLGRLMDFSAVAFYDRAHALTMIYRSGVEAAVVAVALPAFARLRSEAETAAQFRHGMALISAVAWPFFGFLGLMAQPLLVLLFGAQWEASAPVLRLLAVAFAIMAMASLAEGVLIGLGQVRRHFRLELSFFALRAALIPLGALISLEAVAAAQIVVAIGMVAACFRMLAGVSTIRFGATLRALRPSAFVSASALVVPAAVSLAVPPGSMGPAAIAMAGAGCAAGWLAGVWLADHPIKAEVALVLGKLRILGRRPPAAAGLGG